MTYFQSFRFSATSLESYHSGAAAFLQCCRWSYVDWGYDTLAKTPQVHKDSICLCTVPVDFHIRYPRQMNLHYICGMNNIGPSPTNVRQPLKSINRLAVSHSVTRSRDNTWSVSIQKHRPEHLIEYGRYFYSLPTEMGRFYQFFKKFLNTQHACLSTLTSSTH